MLKLMATSSKHACQTAELKQDFATHDTSLLFTAAGTPEHGFSMNLEYPNADFQCRMPSSTQIINA